MDHQEKNYFPSLNFEKSYFWFKVTFHRQQFGDIYDLSKFEEAAIDDRPRNLYDTNSDHWELVSPFYCVFHWKF